MLYVYKDFIVHYLLSCMKFPLVVFHNCLHFSGQIKHNSTTHLFATQQRNVSHFFHYLYSCSNNTLYSHCKLLFSATSSTSFSFLLLRFLFLEEGGILNHFYSTYMVRRLLLVVTQTACAKL